MNREEPSVKNFIKDYRLGSSVMLNINFYWKSIEFNKRFAELHLHRKHFQTQLNMTTFMKAGCIRQQLSN